MIPRFGFSCIVFFCVFAAFPDSLSAAITERPNIVFILADDLGYGELGCFGQQKIRTPNIDRLAATGMRLTDCYAGSAVCAPSRCTLMTGLHTGHCLVRGNARVPLRPNDRTVAELLKQQGYTSALVGKWGLGDIGTTGVPGAKGFDEWFGYLDQVHAHNHFPDFLLHNGQKIVYTGNIVSGGIAAQKSDYSNDLLTRQAIEFLDTHRTGPFFLYLSLIVPHANNELFKATQDGMEVPDYGSYAKEKWPNPEKGRAAMIERLDQSVGAVTTRLRELGIDKNTIVFFSSDNGPQGEGGSDANFFDSNGPLRGIKRDLYDGGIRVPAIAAWPGRIPAGSSSSFPSAFWDFLPTAADLSGATAPSGLDGISITPTLLGKADKQTPRPHPLYWELHERGFHQAMRHDRWKAVRHGLAAPLELYDIVADPGEKMNVAQHNQEITLQFMPEFAKARTDSADWPIKDTRKVVK